MSDPTTASKLPASPPTTVAPPGSLVCPRCGAVVGAGSRFCPACGAALTPPVEVGEDQLITRLRHATQGEYDVLREIGRGGMAAVYLAWDRGLARYVAVKVLLPELAHHPTMSHRFLQEARTAANLDDHPSVVRVYRAKEAEGLRYFVMKYVDGCSLEQLLRTVGPLPPDLAVHVIDQVALALQYAHEHGVVHRDVKPGNVLLDRSGNVVVTDFGIAKVAEAEQLTRTGHAIGTPHYMSPEQWRIEPLTPASDQYALGVVAYYLVTGAVPFDGTQYAIQEQHLRAAVPDMSAGRDGVAAAFGNVVRVMLAKLPSERFADLRSVSQALSAIPRDPAPALRERLSQLIAAVNTPSVREPSSAADVPAAQPEVAVERRSGSAPAASAPAAPVDEGTLVTTAAAVPADVPHTGELRAHETADAPPAPSLGTTTVLRPSPRDGDVAERSAIGEYADDPQADDPHAEDPHADDGYDDDPHGDDIYARDARVTRILAGPISRRDPERRIGPWMTAVVVAAILVAGGIALRSRPSPAATDTVTPPPTPRPPAAAAAPAPAVASGPVTANDSVALDVAGADTAAAAPVVPPPADADSASATDPAPVPGAPAALLIVGGPTRGTLILPTGDSARLRARVNDARGARMVDATVQWASSDPTRVAFRNGWAVAVAPGGPVSVTATSGALTRTVRVVVAAHGMVEGAVRGVARPTSAELRAEVQRFVAALQAHDVEEISRRLAPRAVDGSPSREFVSWLEGTEGLVADAPALGDASDEGSRALVAFRVPLRWRGGGGALGDRGRTDVTFWMTLAHDAQGWHGGEVLLGRRVTPP